MASIGPNSFGSVADGLSTGGAIFSYWSSTSNALVLDSAYATNASGGVTNFLSWTNPGWTVPAGNVPTGIEFHFTGHADAGAVWSDFKVYPIVGGVIQTGATNLAAGNSLTTTDAAYTVGGPGNTAGLTLTLSQVNATDFGVAWSWTNSSGVTHTVSADAATATVYYGPASNIFRRGLGGAAGRRPPAFSIRGL